MSTFSNQIEEIKSLIHSNKSLVYSTLLHLQEQSINDPSSLQTLADNSQILVPLITSDILVDDEEIAAQALKCLGFMIYHPSVVSTILEDDAHMVLEVLARVIMSTKIKSVCNLGVWCISVQQINASFLTGRFHLMLLAVVHALDNPVGSLSTTFEAMQAIMRLSTQLSEKMRESSHIWAPLICRRLLSTDKRERDMSERCLLKIRTTIFPPPAALSKALAEDVKLNLLTGMKDLLNHGMKVQTLLAWGWFIRLLGSQSTKKRHLINDLLKIPEQTFLDHNPQVQIASQVAWEGLVDALIQTPALTCKADEPIRNCIQQMETSGGNSCQIQASGFTKRTKLIMTPLIGIISSKCDVSVHLSCLSTWCYLLYKLDISINQPLVIDLVLNPILEAVFRFGPDINTIWLWNVCLDLLDDFLLAKCRNPDPESNNQVSHHSMPGKCSWKQYPIKWLPWTIDQLDFFIKMINIIISHASIMAITRENRIAACDSALRIFRSLLKGIQMEFKSSYTNYKDVMLCLNTILRFTKKMCEDVNSEGTDGNELSYASLQFLEAVSEELEPSILSSPLYKVALDLTYIENLQSVNDIGHEKNLDISFIGYMDMVSPVVYLIVGYMCVVIQSTSAAERKELIFQSLNKFFKYILLSYGPMENLCVTVCLLYKLMSYRYLQIWIAIAKALTECIDDVKDLLLLKVDSGSDGYVAICRFLSYPFSVCSCPLEKLSPETVSGFLAELNVSALRKHELQHVTEVWKSLYCAFCASKFSNCSETNSLSSDICSILNGCIDQNISMLEGTAEGDLNHKDLGLLYLSGNAVTCVLEQQILTLAAHSDGSKAKHAGDPKILHGISNSLGFSARFLKLSWSKMEADPSSVLLVSRRVFSALARFVSCLHTNQTILLFIKIMNCPLLQWLSHEEIQDASTNEELQHLWAETLNCLRSSQPPIVFDSSFLKLQAPLLQKTLDHPQSFIAEVTITFWNSTYGQQIKLDYPESLLDLLDRLSRNKRINLQKKSLPFLVKRYSIPEVTAQRYRVTATNNRSSKGVGLVEDTVNQSNHEYNLCSGSKRKKLELTEHQKEVRRAHQGRVMDSSGHGPGIRTYTSVDFSQGNEDSQESQEIRDPDSALEMVRGAA